MKLLKISELLPTLIIDKFIKLGLFQSGYLTITDYDRRFHLYTLGFPNKEVEDGFVKFPVPFYTSKSKGDVR